VPRTGMGIVESIAYSRDGRYVLTGSGDNTAKLWEASTGLQIRTFAGHTNKVTSVAFSANDLFVLTGSDDGTARIWDAATGLHSCFSGWVQWDECYSILAGRPIRPDWEG
jgi:WD40 repeat protein